MRDSLRPRLTPPGHDAFSYLRESPEQVAVLEDVAQKELRALADKNGGELGPRRLGKGNFEAIRAQQAGAAASRDAITLNENRIRRHGTCLRPAWRGAIRSGIAPDGRFIHAQSALHNLVTSPALWPAVHPLETLPSMSDVIAEREGHLLIYD